LRYLFGFGEAATKPKVPAKGKAADREASGHARS
jgi:hypothetical protein